MIPIFYAGIGSRQTPEWKLMRIVSMANHLAKAYPHLILRTGGAVGADSAFEEGCLQSNGKFELYLPWKGYNNRINNVVLSEPTQAAIELAKRYHPNSFALKPGALKLHGRNSHIVLGKDLDKPVSFVICYTKPGSGGTSQALRIATKFNIPIVNLWDDTYETQYNVILRWLDLTLKEV